MALHAEANTPICRARHVLTVLAVCAAPATVPQAARAQCDEAPLIAGGAAAGDGLGVAVDVDGDVAVLGAYQADDLGPASGAAVVYRNIAGTWYEEARLVASNGSAGDQFGLGVATEGDLIAIGAPNTDAMGPNAGTVYIFRHVAGTWTEEAILQGSDTDVGDLFGTAVDIDEGDLLVGASRGAGGMGSAYLFRQDGTAWLQARLLVPADGAFDDLFGRSVSLARPFAMIGAARQDEIATNAGAAYVYGLEGADDGLEFKLTASDGSAADNLGYSVALDGDIAVLGAYLDDDAGGQSGSAYVYHFDGVAWTETAKLVAEDGAVGDRFGIAVDVAGPNIIVGAYQDDDLGANSGSAYLFHDDGAVTPTAKLLAPGGAAGDAFGFAVSLHGERALVGAWGHDDPLGGSGAGFLTFGVSGFDCNANGLADACDVLFGLSGDCDHDGVPDECGDPCAPVTIMVPLEAATIQSAIDESVDGGTILVEPGTYFETVDLLGKAITLRSTGGPVVTIIDAGSSGIAVRGDGADSSTTLIEGFTLRGGAGIDGGGLRAIDGAPAIAGCRFESNAATNGAGAYLQSTTPIALQGCTFVTNVAAGSGGGLYVQAPQVTMTGCAFAGNAAADSGGGLLVDADAFFGPTLTMIGNVAGADGGGLMVVAPAAVDLTGAFVVMNTAGGAGGGVSVAGGAVVLDTVEMTQNAAIDGGGLRSVGAAVSGRGLVAAGNVASGSGGALQLTEGSAVLIGARLQDNAAVFGGALDASGPVDLAGARIDSNSATADGGALMSTNVLRLVNCALRDNTAGGSGGAVHGQVEMTLVTLVGCSAASGGAVAAISGAVASSIVWDCGPAPLTGGLLVEHSTVEGGWPGAGNIDTDPLFVAADDLRLSSVSPCVDAGDPGPLPADEHDLDGDGATAEPLPVDLNGQARLVGAAVDMGAFERQGGPCPDLDGDGIVGVAELIAVLLAWGICDGTCPADLDGDGVVGIADFVIVQLNWGPCPEAESTGVPPRRRTRRGLGTHRPNDARSGTRARR